MPATTTEGRLRLRASRKSMPGWPWMLALVALPRGSFDIQPLNPLNFDRGDLPYTSAVFCDVENKAEARRCATPDDLAVGIRMAGAAVALTRRQSNYIGLDYSPDAMLAAGCAPGQPVAVVFKCPFPDGCTECLNCAGVIGPRYADVNAACVADCEDLNGHTVGENPPAADVVDYCRQHARASTNASGCFDGACREEGGLRADFADPRRTP